MKPLVSSLLLALMLISVRADSGWDKKMIENVRIEVPADCQTDVRDTPGSGPVQKLKKYSFRNHVLDLELAFLSFAPGVGDNLDGAGANTTSQLKAVLGEESLTPWKTTTVSGHPARYMATKSGHTREGRRVTLIDDTKAKDRLIIVDISYDSTSSSGTTDSERIMKSVEVE